MATVERTGPAVRAEGGDGAAPDAIPVENPATGEIVGYVPDLGEEQVAELVGRARAVQPAWEALGFEGRAKVLYDWRTWFVENRERVIRAVMEENGKTREDALLVEYYYVADSIGFWARRAPGYLADERHRPHSPFLMGKKVVTRYRPYGVVGVIAPWNYPLALGVGDAIPALAAGNSVVIKPSEVTPLATMLLIDGLREAGAPRDVALVASGRGPTGAALVDHVDMVMFTGSTATGKKVMARAAETLTPVSLELGGKDPMIVLRDADLERAANAAVHWAMSNSGQICMSVERVYVEEPVYDEFVRRVVEKTRGLRQGVPGPGGSVDVGAMTFPPQVDVVERHVSDAVEKGARVMTGGRLREGPGRFWEPTVLTDVDHTMECMTEETFGPTLPIMRVGDEEEAVRLANDSRYGLNSSVFTRDLEKGERIARRIRAGNVCVNDALMNYAAQEATFAGAKESGLGARHGAKGIQKYCEPQTILVTRFAARRDPTMMPYSARVARLLERLVVLMYRRPPRRFRTR